MICLNIFTVYEYIYYLFVFLYYEELAHVIVKAESHNLPSVNYTRKANGIIQSESEGLRTRKVCSINPSPKVRGGEMRCLAKAKSQEKRADSSFLHLFHSDPQGIELCPPILGRAI